MESPIKIIFLGTPEFAVASLHALIEANYNVVAVVTAPDKPAGRGMKLQESAVKRYAVSKSIPVLQPLKLKDPSFLSELKSFAADLQVVVAFRMLPEVVWNMPPLGTVNVHGSLLPHYRGAAPINWVIINGEKETGVSTFKLKHEIDTGNILMQVKIPISERDTAGDLHDRMKEEGANLLVQTINRLVKGDLEEIPQEVLINDPEEPKHAPKIFSEHCKIDWNKNTIATYNLIRGLAPYPGAFTYLNEKLLKVFKAEKEITRPSVAAGEFITDMKTYLKFASTDGYIAIKELQLEGKKRLLIEDFLRGYQFK